MAAEPTSRTKISKINVGGTEYSLGATYDSSGNTIETTYATKSEVPTAYVKSASVSDNQLTLTDASGNTTTFSPSMESAVSSVNGKTGAVELTYSDVGAQVAGSYVTVDTTQDITGIKTFKAPTNISGTEQATTIYETSNGGRIIFGKEGPNSGTMIGLDQVKGTRRLNFRASATAGAIVWQQPESGSCLYMDVGTVNFRQAAITCTKSATFNSTATFNNTVKFAYANYKSAGYLYTDSSGNLQKGTLATVATSGSYNDLSDKPTIPTYTAGDNVQISDANVISATDTTYTAGDNITIDSNNKISSDAIIKLQDNGTTTAGTWLAKTDQISAYEDGQVFLYKITKAGGSGATTLNINGLGAKNVYTSGTSYLTNSHFDVGQYILLTYNATKICFRVINFYDSTDIDNVRTRYFKPYAAEAIYRYKFVVLDADNRLVPIVTTNQTSIIQVAKTPTAKAFKPHNMWFYNNYSATVNAGASVTANTLYWQTDSNNPWPYNFNESVPAYRLIYLRGTYDKKTDLFTLYNDGSSPCKSYYTFVPTNTASITLTDYFVSGYYYWLIAGSYSIADNASLLPHKELYYFDGTNLTPVSNLGDPTPTNMVTTNTKQTITGSKTFTSNIYFNEDLYLPYTSRIFIEDVSGTYSGDTLSTLLAAKVDANTAITGDTKAKITYDSKGLVTAGADLTASDIPSLPASKITSGTFADARIASASTWNAKQSALSTTQLAACNSGITSTKVSTYDGYATTISGKQDAITSSNKLAASLVSGLSTVATSGSYSDLTNKPTIDVSLSTTSTNAVQNSIVTSAINSKADSSALGDQVTFSYDSTTGTLTISPK